MAESLEREIRDLRTLLFSERDPEGRGFAPLADALRRAGDLAQALELVEEGVARLPDFATGHVVAGWIHRARGEGAEAEASFRRVLELDDENVSALRGLGFLLADRGAGDEARAIFGRLDELDPGDPEVRARLTELAGAELAGVASVASETGPEAGARGAADAVPVVSIGSLAPADGSRPLVDVALLAPEVPRVSDGSVPAAANPPEGVEEAGPVVGVVGIASLAPDPDRRDPAPEAEASVDEIPIVEVASLAPDPEPESEGDGGEEVGSEAEAGVVAEAETEVGAEAETEVGAEAESEADAEAVVPLPDRGARTGAPEPGDADGGPWTRTMAELYARQGLTDRAARIYRRLLEAAPDAPDLRARLAELEGQDAGTAAAPTAPTAPPPADGIEDLELEDLARHMASGPDVGHDREGPFAWGGESGSDEEDDEEGSPEVPRVSEYFRSLLGWVPSGGDAEAEASGGESDRNGTDDHPSRGSP